MKIVTYILMLALTTGFAQSNIEGYIFDESTDESLPYATIRIISGNANYTISNEDGKFQVSDKFSKDSLEVTYIGYESKKVVVFYFEKNPKLYLNPKISILDEVVVVANKEKDYAFVLLGKLIEKYRNKKEITHSKAFLTLTSSARSIPIEQIEGFYNSEQNLSNGIINLKVKSGRFGQNKSFPFYSLDNTEILSDFQLFTTSKQILPHYPGNMTSNAIKRNYNVKINECKSCSDKEISISFSPKKANGRLFYGKILFIHGQLIIKKIELGIKNPTTKALTSINDKVVITPNEIQLNVVFSPIDFEKIQYLDFSFRMNYRTKKVLEIIDSHSFLYFYDYNTSFEVPYFTKIISFNNDYDKMVALQASDDFWNANYQFPKSFNEKRSMDFMKKYGFLINYDNALTSKDLKYTKPSVLSWHKDKRLEWAHIKQGLTTNNDKNNLFNRHRKADIEADKEYHSISEINKANLNRSSGNTEFNISYMLDTYKNENGDKQFVSRTLFDINSSYYKFARTNNKLVYLNIIFDLYEVYRQSIEAQLTDRMTFDEAKTLYTNAYEEASIAVKNLNKETKHGANFQNLVRWNNEIKSKLNIDNFALVH